MLKRARNKCHLENITNGWVSFQKTKLCSVDRFAVNQLCGRGDWGFSFAASSGSGGELYTLGINQ